MPITPITGPDGQGLYGGNTAVAPAGGFVVTTDIPPNLGVDRTNLGYIYDIAADATTAVPYTGAGTPPIFDNLAVDNEGARIAYAAEREFTGEIVDGINAVRNEFFIVVDAAGNEEVRIPADPGLATENQGVFFLGGDKIAYTLGEQVRGGIKPAGPPDDLYIYDLTTGDVASFDLGADNDAVEAASRFPGGGISGVSADGDTVIVNTQNEDLNSVPYLFDVSEATATRLFVDDRTFNLELTGDGETVFFLDVADNNGRLFALDVAGGTVRDPLGQDTGATDFVASPDGRFVAFTSDFSDLVADDADGAEDLFVLDTTTDALTRVDLPATGGDIDRTRVIAVEAGDDAPVVVLDAGRTRDDPSQTDLFRADLDLIAGNDAARTAQDTGVAIDVLANDVDFDEDGLAITLVGPAANGSVAIDDRGTADTNDDLVLYTPDPGFTGEDAFAYTVEDGGGAVDAAEVMVLVQSTAPADLVVTTLDDAIDAADGEVSLREAVAAANFKAGADTITFADGLKGGTLLLDGGPLTITDDLTIDGDAADGGVGGVTLTEFAPTYTSGGGTYTRGFIAVESGVRAGFEDLTITQDGRYAFDEAAGTKLFGNGADISLDRVFVGDIAIRYGATAVRVQGGSLSVADSIIEGIYGSDGNARGIEATDGAAVSVARTALSGINGTYTGFAVDVEGTLNLQDSAITDVSGRYGGFGVRVDGTLDVANVTVSDLEGLGGYDDEPGGGAGVSILAGGSGTITNATIAGNVVNAGIEVDEGADLRLENSVIAENYQSQNIETRGRDTPVSNEENLILRDVVGTIESNGHNVFTQDAVDGAAAGDALGADPREVFINFRSVFYAGFPGEVDPVVLPAAAANGGPTPTIALLDDPTNPAIGQADPGTAPSLDQRGFARDAAPDAGSFEAGADGPVSPPPPAGDAFVVTTADDVVDTNDGVTSLREAVDAANARAGADTITFADDLKGAALLLGGGPLRITDDLTIDGDAADGGVGGVTLTEFVPTFPPGGGTDTRGFIVVEGGVKAGFEDLTITDGGDYASYSTLETKLFGAGADIGLDRVRIGDIGREFGVSAVRVEGGSLNVADSVIENVGGSYGGSSGIEATDGAAVSVARTTLSNIAVDGIGIDVEGTLSLVDSTLADIRARYGSSIGVQVDGRFNLLNVTITDLSSGSGYDSAGVSILGNSSGTITNATIAGNDVDGGVEIADGAALVLQNSVVVGNPTDVSGSIDSNGGNVFGDAAVDGAAAGDVLGAAAADLFSLVDTPYGYQAINLADNGGPTETIALKDAPSNPAIGQAVAADAPPTDQRGFARDADPDAGSFEAGTTDGGGSPPGLLSVDVTFLSADADFDNTLGYYVRDAAGGFTGEAGILFAEVGDDAPEAGAVASVVGYDPADVGLFLVRDGANLGVDWTAGAVAVEDGKLVYTAPDGSATSFKDYQIHFDTEEGQLNILFSDPAIYNWEDKALSEGSYDGDFDDAVFKVGFGRVPAPVPPLDDDAVVLDAPPAGGMGGTDLFGV